MNITGEKLLKNLIMNITGEKLLILAEHAKKNGTTEAWTDVAMKWIKQADEHIRLAFHREIGWAITPEEYDRLLETNSTLEKKIKKMTAVYSAALDWDRDATLHLVLKEKIKEANRVLD